jgi:pyruvyltransferase
MYWFDKVPNLGDAISPLIVSRLSGLTPVWADKTERCKLLAVGSILNYARRGDVVWGSGFIKEDARLRSTKIIVTAVRGPLTRKRLIEGGVECPEIYGDPAILLPLLCPPKPAEKRYSLGIIPHYAEKELVKTGDPSIKVIDIQGPLETFLEDLLSCRRIVSSSLHGIIIAESYGIPADWLILSDKVRGSGFKFSDYFLSTGREAPQPLGWSQIAIERDLGKPDFEREKLMEAFPFKKA